MRRFTNWVLLLFLVLAPLAQPAGVQAAGIVGDGTPASCNSNTLSQALTDGGDVTFNCGADPLTIIVDTYVITSPTTLDGGGLITLDGENLRQIFLIQAGGNLTLRNITLVRGGIDPGNGGAIANYGTLLLENSTISNSETRHGYGGAIYNEGTLTLTNSQLLNNTTNSGFTGGALNNLNGTVTIENSLFQGNYADYGGAIDSVGTLTIRNSSFQNNVARSGLGGALDIGGTVLVENTRLTNNFAERGGGAINTTEAAILTVRDSQLTGNNTNLSLFNDGFGGGINNAGQLTLERVALEDNHARYGGGLYIAGQAAQVDISASLFHANTALSVGGVYMAGKTLKAESSTFSGNTSTEKGGALYAAGGDTTLTSLTLYNNQAAAGALDWSDSLSSLSLTGVILAGNQATNCGSQVTQYSAGYNLSDDDSCGLASIGDQEMADALLEPLADNGGATLTHLPGPGSPVIDKGGPTCPALDQRGVVRPSDAACDIGAVESAPRPEICGGTFIASADSSVASTAPGQAGGDSLDLKVFKTAAGESRALLRFDLSSAFPVETYIRSATLELPVKEASAAPTGDLLGVRSVASAWDEAQLTWNTLPALPVSFASGGVTGDDQIIRLDVTALVTHWATGQIPQTSLAIEPGGLGVNLLLNSRETQNGPRLLVDCSPAPQAKPGNSQVRADAQEAALQRLTAASSVLPRVDTEAGKVVFAEFDVTPPAEAGSDPAEVATWFLDSYRDLLRLSDPAALWQLARRSEDDQHIFFRQLYNGLPVLVSELAVHFSGSHIVGLSGRYATEVALPATPLLAVDFSEQLARTALDPQAERVGDTQLRYVDLSLIGGGAVALPNGGVAGINPSNSAQQGPPRLAFLAANPRPASPHLAWQVNLRGPGGHQAVYVDAHTGRVLYSEVELDEGFDLDLENGNNEPAQDLCGWFDDDDIGWNYDSDASMVSGNLSRIYYWWRNTLGRDSYDNDGEQIEVNIHVKYNPLNAAYGLCDLFFIGNGMGTLDILAHEFGHAITEDEIGWLGSSGQSGALNESYSDIFAALIDGNWTMGEGSPVGIIRDMSNPTLYSTSCNGVSLKHPDRMSLYLNIPCDKGGIHANTGVNNKAAYLIIWGGAQNGRTVTALGSAKASRLFYNVIANRLGKGANMVDASNAAIAEAKSLRGSGFFSTFDVCQVINAYTAVELGSGDSDCNGLEDGAQDDDGDGVPNAYGNGVQWDNCPNKKNLNQGDVDGDGIGDSCDNDNDNDGKFNEYDNCPYVYNPSQRDRDNDGAGDACDNDADDDFINNTVDNCPSIANFDQSDVDRDRIGDVCDQDADNDRICGLGGPRAGGVNGILPGGCQPGAGRTKFLVPTDNCSLAYNPGQEDNDIDGVGDACDLCPGIQTAENGDPDHDGLGNGCDLDDDNDGVADYNADGSPLDNCREVPNANQVDTNKNGIGYVCDEAERANWGLIKDRYVRVHFWPGKVFHLPIPICPQCGTALLPKNLESLINLQLPVNVYAQVVDSSGKVVARSNGAAALTQLRFRPAAITLKPAALVLRQNSQALLDLTSEAAASSATTKYYLEIFPAPGVDLTQDYDLKVNVDEAVVLPGIGKISIYLPYTAR